MTIMAFLLRTSTRVIMRNVTISSSIRPTLLTSGPASSLLSSRRFAATSHENHSKLWTVERGLSAGLLLLMPGAFVMPNPVGDYALALALVVHVHWGLEAIVVDYIRPSIFGQIIPRVALALLYLLSAMSLGGLFYFNYTDTGLVNGIKMAWKKL